MYSLRGPKLKIFAGILAVIVLIAGVQMTLWNIISFFGLLRLEKMYNTVLHA